MSKTEILLNRGINDQKIQYFLEKAPYYPKYYSESIEDPKLLGTFYFVTCKVRHLHESIWYVRHHIQELFVAKEDKSKGFNDILDRLIQEVYLDIKFGVINPDLKRMNGEPLDPKDKLQISEEERLGLK